MAILNRKDAESSIPLIEKMLNAITKKADQTSGRVDAIDESLTEERTARASLIRELNDGTLTCYEGETYGIYTNTNGSVDIVSLTWADDTPSIDSTLASFDANGLGLTGSIEITGHVTAGTRFVSEYTYNHAGSGTTANLYVNDNGNFVKTAGSSKRYKEDIKDADRTVFDPHKLYDLHFRQFRYKDGYFEDANKRTYQGFIAEEVATVYPSAAIYNEDGSVETWSERELIPPMLALIQELNDRITILENQRKEIENVNSKN